MFQKLKTHYNFPEIVYLSILHSVARSKRVYSTNKEYYQNKSKQRQNEKAKILYFYLLTI